MHVFAIGMGLDQEAAGRLHRGVIDVGQEFRLDPQTLWDTSSVTRMLTVAGMHHGASAIGERRYVSFSDKQIALYDGLPLDSSGSVAAHDAGQLLPRWSALPNLLEGEFCVARIDLAADAVEVLQDPLGMLPVFYATNDQGAVISTSANIVASVLCLRRPDPMAVASFVALGWVMRRHTFLADIRILAGGTVHRLDTRGLRSNQHFGAASLLRRESRPPSVSALAEQLKQLTSAAVVVGGAVRCALTAGRDTRVMAAILRSIDARTAFYTGGEPNSIDVMLALELAAHFRLDHEVQHVGESQRDWARAAERFIRQTEGLSSLVQLVDYLELDEPVDRLSITLWGVGGEIGRAGAGTLSNISPNLPLVSRLASVQRRLLCRKIDDQGLLTDDGRELVAQHLQEFADERLREGWPTRELSDAFYTFERVACWGAGGVRRASGVGDLFSPYCTRPFMRYCFSLSPGERYLEMPHYRLLSQLDPSLRDHRYQTPFPLQRRWLAGSLATRQLWRTLRAGERHGADSVMPSGQEPRFLTRWLASHAQSMAEVADNADAEVWQLIDRDHVAELLRPGCPELSAHTDTLLRIFTPLWFLQTVRQAQDKAER